MVRFIAAGGMGEVYETEDTVLAEPVAVKLLRPALVAKPGAQERFAEEIRLARKVTHPNVCRVFDVGIDGELIFFTMELHRGETLATLLHRTGALGVDAATPLVRQLCARVVAAHEAEVIHADLKPSNLLLTGSERVRLVITDFGLATPCCAQLGCCCAMPHLIGTPAYVSPEQVEGVSSRPASDIFSIGVILFEMLTGELPYRGDNLVDIARARLIGPPPSPRSLRPEVDATWDEVVRACLARAPGDRPRADQLAAALGVA